MTVYICPCFLSHSLLPLRILCHAFCIFSITLWSVPGPTHPPNFVLFFFSPIKSSLCCTYILGYKAFHWRVVDLPMSTHVKNRLFIFKQLLVASSFSMGMGLHAHRPLHPPFCDLVWLVLAQVLYMLSQLLWVHVCSCLLCSLSLQSSTASGFYSLCAPFYAVIPANWKEGMWYRCPIWWWAFSSLSISEPWQVWVHIHCHLLQKGASLVGAERCTGLNHSESV